jgi:hypothetical protein
MQDYLDFPNEVWENITKDLSYEELVKLCQTNPRYRYLCDDPRVWRFFLRRDFGTVYTGIDPKAEYLRRVALNRSAVSIAIIFEYLPKLNPGELWVIIVEKDFQPNYLINHPDWRNGLPLPVGLKIQTMTTDKFRAMVLAMGPPRPPRRPHWDTRYVEPIPQEDLVRMPQYDRFGGCIVVSNNRYSYYTKYDRDLDSKLEIDSGA